MTTKKSNQKPKTAKELIGGLKSLIDSAHEEQQKKIDICNKRRIELQKNGDFIIHCLNYSRILMNGEISKSADAALAGIMAILISAELDGMIKINDKFNKKNEIKNNISHKL